VSEEPERANAAQVLEGSLWQSLPDTPREAFVKDYINSYQPSIALIAAAISGESDAGTF